MDLALLGVFKYTNFALDTVNGVSTWLGHPAHLPLWDIVLPVGISFYTFHTITYIVDAYRGVITPTRNFFEFASYVSLFPQLVAGPIVRFRQIERDLENIDHAERRANLNIGWSFFLIGLIKKVLLADTIAAVINPALARYSDLSTVDAWMCMLGYSYQLYFDFSGYSDMAVGLGYLFGLRLPQNFNSPYRATDIADFWRRWHISLSSFLRDYVYIPLGGNRGARWMVYRNLMITMLLGGLWHGASWNFVLWGAIHGGMLAFERAQGRQGFYARLPRPLRVALTFLVVCLSWVFFRAKTLPEATGYLASLFGAAHAGPASDVVAGAMYTPYHGGMFVVAALTVWALPNTWAFTNRLSFGRAVSGMALLVVSVLLMWTQTVNPFLYFQF